MKKFTPKAEITETATALGTIEQLRVTRQYPAYIGLDVHWDITCVEMHKIQHAAK